MLKLGWGSCQLRSTISRRQCEIELKSQLGLISNMKSINTGFEVQKSTTNIRFMSVPLFGSTITVLSVLQRVQNSLARVVLQADYSTSSISLLQQLHRLPIEKRINFNLSTLTYKVFASGSPAYLSSLLTQYYPAHTLRSSDQLLIQHFPTKSNFGFRAFCTAAPYVWNPLPYPVRASPTLPSFKRALKSYYFQSSFHSSLY